MFLPFLIRAMRNKALATIEHIKVLIPSR